MKLEIEKTLVLNTKHITKEASEWLTSQNSALNLMDTYTYGWRLYTGPYPTPLAIPHGCIKACIGLARENDCQWIKLDRDGPVIPNLSTYEW